LVKLSPKKKNLQNKINKGKPGSGAGSRDKRK